MFPFGTLCKQFQHLIPDFVWSLDTPSCEWCLWGDPHLVRTHFIHAFDAPKGWEAELSLPSQPGKGKAHSQRSWGNSRHLLFHPSLTLSFQAGPAPRLLLLQSVPSCVKWQPTNFLELVGRWPDAGNICGKASFLSFLNFFF